MKKDDICIVSTMGGIGLVFAVIAIAVESTVATWIWGVLAVAMIGLTVYAIIDYNIKTKRKPKDFADVFATALKEHVSKPEFAENFAKRTEESYEKKQVLFDSQRPNEDNYGYSSLNPIMTLNVFRSDDYLNKLRTLDGRSFTWKRNGSHCVKEIGGIQNVMVDEYQLFLNGVADKIIYLCPYSFESDCAPKGMKLAD